jgi:hypothetical protein
MAGSEQQAAKSEAEDGAANPAVKFFQLNLPPG